VVQPKILSFSEKVQIGVGKLREPFQHWIPAQRAKPRDPAPFNSLQPHAVLESVCVGGGWKDCAWEARRNVPLFESKRG